jgi:LysM repeat protein
MARSGFRVGALTAPRHRGRWVGLKALPAVALVVLLLPACGPFQRADPTIPPAPELVIVTVTPGLPVTPTPGQATLYVVQSGDTLWSIAIRFGVPEDDIVAENGLSDRDQLYAGQELRIPAPVGQ